MKPNEIQIGDWVYSTFSKLPCKVTYLKLHESGYASVETTNVVGVKDIASLVPIPITPEILEKNGFIHYTVTDFYMWKEESSEPIHLDNYNENGWRLRINCDNIPCECKYVHQLQHALKLCGIEKTIEL